MKGGAYHFDAVYCVLSKKKRNNNHFMINLREGEKKKKNVEGASKSSVNGRQIFDRRPKPSALG